MDCPHEFLKIIQQLDGDNRDYFKGVVKQATEMLEKQAEAERMASLAKAKKQAVAEVEAAAKEAEEKKNTLPAPKTTATPVPAEARSSASNAGIPRPRERRLATPDVWKFLLPEAGADLGIYIVFKLKTRKISVQFTQGLE